VALICPSPVLSVDVAPRITDREIVERLTRLEEGQKALAQRIDDTNSRLDDGFKALNQRIDDTNRRLEEGFKSLSQRIEAGDSSLNRRIDELRDLLLWGFGVLFSGMLALVGFVLWDRRTALAPAVRQMEGLKEREERLEAALREYASKSPELAEALKKMGLL
jgi:DNA repair exonuclease SbcCD ATPase subunit